MSEMGTPKTYKLYVGGAFVRSESGRVEGVDTADGTTIRVAAASRKDLRDAVVSARGAAPAWAGTTPYLRGQILYRVAEMLDGRREQFVSELELGGMTTADAVIEVDAAVDTWVYWAGWCDKLAQVLGSVNPVSGPFLNVSGPEPVGVVGIVASQERPLSGLSDLLGPALCAGNTVVALGSRHSPFAPLTFGEVLATSDVPAGAANLLIGPVEELAPWLADHHDVDGLELSGVTDPELLVDLQIRSAENMKRVATTHGARTPATPAAFMDIKTVWHPARL